jgi:hypothetical protein
VEGRAGRVGVAAASRVGGEGRWKGRGGGGTVVGLVAYDRMADSEEVSPYLMRAACDRNLFFVCKKLCSVCVVLEHLCTNRKYGEVDRGPV